MIILLTIVATALLLPWLGGARVALPVYGLAIAGGYWVYQQIPVDPRAEFNAAIYARDHAALMRTFDTQTCAEYAGNDAGKLAYCRVKLGLQ